MEARETEEGGEMRLNNSIIFTYSSSSGEGGVGEKGELEVRVEHESCESCVLLLVSVIVSFFFYLLTLKRSKEQCCELNTPSCVLRRPKARKQ